MNLMGRLIRGEPTTPAYYGKPKPIDEMVVLLRQAIEPFPQAHARNLSHAHRVLNRWGYVRTRSPKETEMALRLKLPKRYWVEIKGLLVAFGKQVCTPLRPFCSRCPMGRYCDQVGVAHSR